MTHTISELASVAGDLLVRIDGDPTTRVSGVAYDSRAVEPGDLFFCIVGDRADGHDFAADAVAAGATALCVEKSTGARVPEIVVRSVRRAMPWMSARALGDPTRDLLMLGVTGTNGKTTTAFLLEAILAADGRKPGLIGTIETHVAGQVRPATRTTPESLDLQELFAEMRAAGVDSVAMEVTSHALSLGRVDGIRFAASAFTNLTQDHLDFHPTMDDYLAAKVSLFTEERTDKAAVNLDDPAGRKIVEHAQVPVIGFGSTPDAEVRAADVKLEPAGSSFVLVTPKGEIDIATSLPGPFNVSNCLAAAATALQAGIGLDAIASGIAALRAVPGRFEAVDKGQPFSVIVDYAHTPDSLDNVLAAGRRMLSSDLGRLICVFGAGGDRDRGKRALMGMVVGRSADVVIVTSDNPRSEAPMEIIGEIVEGVAAVRPQGPEATEPDRAAAIALAIERAEAGDVVIIAGKGHETTQEFADHTIDFDDRLVAADALVARGWGG